MAEGSASEEYTYDGKFSAVPGDATRLDGFLPNSLRQTHASFLLTLSNGDLGCVWFAGSEEGQPDVSIYFSRLKPGASEWTPDVKISDDPTRSEQNPVLFETPTGELWVLYTSQDFGNQDTSVVRRRVSRDNGESWGPIETMFDEPGTFIRNPVIVLSNGDWLLPVFRCRPVPGEKWHGQNDVSAVKISTDQGKTWSDHEVPDSLGSVHMNIIDIGGGKLIALYRDRYADRIQKSRSSDNGRTWSVPEPTDLPNNNSSIQARKLSDGTIALVYNHISSADSADRRKGLYDGIDDGKPPVGTVDPANAKLRPALWGTPRSPMSIVLSSDNGETWGPRRDLETGTGAALSNDTSKAERRNRELSYPTVAETPDGMINVAYTHFRRGIRFMRFPKAWVSAG